MRTLPVVAIDPGQTGACVVLDGDGRMALAAWAWTLRKRKAGRVYSVEVVLFPGPPATYDAPSLHAIGDAVRPWARGRYLLVVEGLFVPKPRPKQAHAMARGDYKAGGDGWKYLGQVKRVLALAEAAALVSGPLLAGAEGIERPTASTWRPQVLGLKANASSKLSEDTAKLLLTTRPPLVSGLGELAENPHVAEAACMAAWGHTLLVQRAQEAAHG